MQKLLFLVSILVCLVNMKVLAQEESFSTEARDLLTSEEPVEPVESIDEEINPENEFFIIDPTQVVIPLIGDDDGGFFFGFGQLFPRTTSLQGPARERVVLRGSRVSSDFPIVAYLGQKINDSNIIGLELAGDVGGKGLGFDLGYVYIPESLPGAFAFSVFNRRGINPAFEGDDPEVDLPNTNDPWEHRLGFGFEYLQILAPKLGGAVGINYQKISIRDKAFTNTLQPVDEFGNQLTVSGDGQDDLLTIDLVLFYFDLNSLDIPTSGTQIRFGIDQSIPVGKASILFSRFNGSFTQYIPLKLLNTEERLDTLIFDLQAGTMIGDVAPYEAYNLGGSRSVRGYQTGGISSSSSFIQLTTEYRVPLLVFKAFKEDFDIRGSVYFDYATDLGTASKVIGEPAVARNKPGDGFGYGVGLNLYTPIGLFRLETGLNDLGEFRFSFLSGDRF